MEFGQEKFGSGSVEVKGKPENPSFDIESFFGDEASSKEDMANANNILDELRQEGITSSSINELTPDKRGLIVKTLKSASKMAALFVLFSLMSPSKAKGEVKIGEIETPPIAAGIACQLNPNSAECDIANALEDNVLDTYDLEYIITNGIRRNEQKKEENARQEQERNEIIKRMSMEHNEAISDVAIDWNAPGEYRDYKNKFNNKYGVPKVLEVPKPENSSRTVIFSVFYNDNLKGKEESDRIRYVVMTSKRKDSGYTVEAIQAVGEDMGLDTKRYKGLVVLYTDSSGEMARFTPEEAGGQESYQNMMEKIAADFTNEWSKVKQDTVSNIANTIGE